MYQVFRSGLILDIGSWMRFKGRFRGPLLYDQTENLGRAFELLMPPECALANRYFVCVSVFSCLIDALVRRM